MNDGMPPRGRAGGPRHGRRHGPRRFGVRTLFDLADDVQLLVPTSCRRTGRCHECVVEVLEGMDALAEPTEAESFLKAPYRLACQAAIVDEQAPVRFEALRLEPQILTEGLDETRTELDVSVCHSNGQVLHDGAAIDRYRGRLLGLAIDLGTTTIVMYLVDLESGHTLDRAAFENPQRFGGSDIMHRIAYDAEDARGELRRAAVRAINHAILAMLRALGLSQEMIYEAVVVGNTTMRDILFRLNVQSIGQRPYKSSVEHEFLAGERASTALSARARRIGLRINPRAIVYGAPLIGSHVGGDTAAALLATGMADGHDEVRMLVDVGTNTEVVIGNRERLVAASCPAGPAFEGGAVKFGMPGREGAIESVRLGKSGRQTAYRTIGETEPRGLCGSGLIDVLAELRKHEVMNEKGVFIADRKQFDMAIVPEHGITFSKEDASHLGQAKAANFCGQFITMREFGVHPSEVDTLFLAGGFANYIDTQNAIDIGFLAPVPIDRIQKIGNAAVEGARKLLLSRAQRSRLESLVSGIEHIELETTPDFFELFVEGCLLKPMPANLDLGA